MLGIIKTVRNGINWAKGGIKILKTLEALFESLEDFGKKLDNIWGIENLEVNSKTSKDDTDTKN